MSKKIDATPFLASEVSVGNGVAKFGSTTFPIRNLASVSSEVVPASKIPSIVLGFIGLICMSPDVLGVFGGLVIIAAAVGLWFYRKPTYALEISQNNGRFVYLSNKDRSVVEDVRDQLMAEISRG